MQYKLNDTINLKMLNRITVSTKDFSEYRFFSRKKTGYFRSYVGIQFPY
jgi:hypothetical protein